MATLPLDIDSVLGEVDATQPAPPVMPAGTTWGHVHLQVANLRDAEAFYSGALGFEVMVRTYPGALFVAAGGYHTTSASHLGERRRLNATGRLDGPALVRGRAPKHRRTPSAWQTRRDRQAPRCRRPTARPIALDPWRDGSASHCLAVATAYPRSGRRPSP